MKNIKRSLFNMINTYRNQVSEKIRAETKHERKGKDQQNIIIFQAKAYITKIDNLIILFIMNIKRTGDYALIHKIETLKKNKIYKKS